MSSYRRVTKEMIDRMVDLFPQVKGDSNTKRYREIGRIMNLNETTIRTHIQDLVEHIHSGPNLYDQIDEDIARGVPVHEAVNRVMSIWTGAGAYVNNGPTSERSYQIDRRSSSHGKGHRAGGIWA